MEVKPGVKVRCIDSDFVDERTNPFRKSELNLPERGKIYTIREVVDTSYGIGLRLKEVINKRYYFSDIRRREEPIFAEDRFEVLP